MTNFSFLQSYLKLQKEIMFDELVDLGFATICFSRNSMSTFWNNAIVDCVINQDQLETIGSHLHKLGRKSALYYENRQDLQPLTTWLEELGYKREAADAFMVYGGAEIDMARFDQVRKVETLADLEKFLDIFDQCYKKDDLTNPYGELGDYLDVARTMWKKHSDANRMEYFMAYKGTRPVAVASLTNYVAMGYISNVGSTLAVRGEGFGKLVTMYCVAQSKKHGNSKHYLITEEGTNPNFFYKALGFDPIFTARLMVLN